MRRFRTLLSTRPELHPMRALVTPTWLLALVVLALNDHIFKGSGLLPGAVTGKLSDFAGMIVAPVLFAALLRVRTRRGLLACHAAVGAVFAGINVSPVIADAWAWLMDFVYPWHITVDPTDLVALPALALGWRALVPAMTRPLPTLSPAVLRTAEACAVAVGSFFCVATSDDDGSDGQDPPNESLSDTGDPTETDGLDYEDIEADVYLHNAATTDIRVRTRPVRADVQLDCSAVAEDPGLLLSERLFGAGQTVTLPPSTNVGVRDLGEQRACYAVRVEGDAIAAPFVLFWLASDVRVRTIDGDIDDPEQHTDGAVLLTADPDGQVTVQESRSQVVFPISESLPEDAFLPGPDSERLAWSDPPLGVHQLADVDVGPDGCVAATFVDVASRWYLCAPEGAFPFAVDEWVSVADGFGTVSVERVPDPQDPVAVPVARLHLARGEQLPEVDGLVLAGKVDYTAAIGPDPACGTVARPDDVTARFEGGEVIHLLPGEDTELDGATSTLRLWVAHAEERVVLDPACAEGPDDLGADIEVAALIVAKP